MEPSSIQGKISQSSDSRTDSFFFLFWMIWVHPRQAIRHIINKSPHYFAFQLIFAYAISLFVAQVLRTNWVINWVQIKGGLSIFIGFYLLGILLSKIGNLLGGKATSPQATTALAWAAIPIMIGNILYYLIPFLIHNLIVNVIFMIIELICISWSFPLEIYCVAEVHQFANWKGLISWVVSIVVMIIVGVILSATRIL